MRGAKTFSRVKISDLPAYVPINFDPSLIYCEKYCTQSKVDFSSDFHLALYQDNIYIVFLRKKDSTKAKWIFLAKSNKYCFFLYTLGKKIVLRGWYLFTV